MNLINHELQVIKPYLVFVRTVKLQYFFTLIVSAENHLPTPCLGLSRLSWTEGFQGLCLQDHAEETLVHLAGKITWIHSQLETNNVSGPVEITGLTQFSGNSLILFDLSKEKRSFVL